jgi:hypothetical protein
MEAEGLEYKLTSANYQNFCIRVLHAIRTPYSFYDFPVGILSLPNKMQYGIRLRRRKKLQKENVDRYKTALKTAARRARSRSEVRSREPIPYMLEDVIFLWHTMIAPVTAFLLGVFWLQAEGRLWQFLLTAALCFCVSQTRANIGWLAAFLGREEQTLRSLYQEEQIHGKRAIDTSPATVESLREIRSLIRHVQHGGTLQTHDDVPEDVREQLYAEEQQRLEH